MYEVRRIATLMKHLMTLMRDGVKASGVFEQEVEVRRKEDEMTFAFGTLVGCLCVFCMCEYMRQYVFVSVFRKCHCVLLCV